MADDLTPSEHGGAEEGEDPPMAVEHFKEVMHNLFHTCTYTTEAWRPVLRQIQNQYNPDRKELWNAFEEVPPEARRIVVSTFVMLFK
jgi:hypothetical protein